MNSNTSPISLIEIAARFDAGVKPFVDLEAEEKPALNKFRAAKLRILRTVLEDCLKGELPRTGILSSPSELVEYMNTRCDLEVVDFLHQVMPQSDVTMPRH